MKRLLFIAIACLVLVCGCAVYTHQGLYDISASDGWRREASEGTTFFYPPSARNAEGFVAFTTEKKGELLMVAYFPGKTVHYEKKELRIVPHDGGSPYLASVDVPRVLVSSTSNFTIEVPPFTVDGTPMPSIVAVFKWSDRKYREYRILQGP